MSFLKSFNHPMVNKDLISSMESIQQEINDFFDHQRFPSNTKEFWNKGQFVPAADISESKTGYHVELETPGMSAKDMTIEVKDNVLVVQGEKNLTNESEEKGIIRRERSFGSFYRALPFPKELDAEKIKAKIKDGILQIDIEKTAEQTEKYRKINISEL
jgi:HSP20 family protein